MPNSAAINPANRRAAMFSIKCRLFTWKNWKVKYLHGSFTEPSRLNIKPLGSGTSRKNKVFIEIIQNVSYYSAESNNNTKGLRSGIGWFTIDELTTKFQMVTGNLVEKGHGPILLKNCNEINSMNEEELRNLKRETRSKASIKDIGAHIGLIQTGLMTGNPLTAEINEVDNKHSFFTLKVEINK